MFTVHIYDLNSALISKKKSASGVIKKSARGGVSSSPNLPVKTSRSSVISGSAGACHHSRQLPLLEWLCAYSMGNNLRLVYTALSPLLLHLEKSLRLGDARRCYARYGCLAGGFASSIVIDSSLVSDLPGFAMDVCGKCRINKNT